MPRKPVPEFLRQTDILNTALLKQSPAGSALRRAGNFYTVDQNVGHNRIAEAGIRIVRRREISILRNLIAFYLFRMCLSRNQNCRKPRLNESVLYGSMH